MATQETIKEETEEEYLSTQDGQNEESNAKNKEVHFLILRPSEEKIDFAGLDYETKNKIEPKIAFQKNIDKQDGTFLEQIVFKFKKKLKKKRKRQ
jgi:hypothetical protein